MPSRDDALQTCGLPAAAVKAKEKAQVLCALQRPNILAHLSEAEAAYDRRHALGLVAIVAQEILT